VPRQEAITCRLGNVPAHLGVAKKFQWHVLQRAYAGFCRKVQTVLGVDLFRPLIHFVVCSALLHGLFIGGIEQARISPILIASAIKILTPPHDDDIEGPGAPSIKLSLGNASRFIRSNLCITPVCRNPGRHDSFRSTGERSPLIYVEPLFSLIQSVWPKQYPSTSTHFNSRRFSGIYPTDAYANRLPRLQKVWGPISWHHIGPLIHSKLTSHFLDLFIHGSPLQKSNAYTAESNDSSHSCPSDYPFFVGVGSLITVAFLILLIIVALCVCWYAIWLMRWKWSVRIIWLGIAMHVFAGALLWHGLQILAYCL
jgi:hypothetical protein